MLNKLNDAMLITSVCLTLLICGYVITVCLIHILSTITYC